MPSPRSLYHRSRWLAYFKLIHLKRERLDYRFSAESGLRGLNFSRWAKFFLGLAWALSSLLEDFEAWMLRRAETRRDREVERLQRAGRIRRDGQFLPSSASPQPLPTPSWEGFNQIQVSQSQENLEHFDRRLSGLVSECDIDPNGPWWGRWVPWGEHQRQDLKVDLKVFGEATKLPKPTPGKVKPSRGRP